MSRRSLTTLDEDPGIEGGLAMVLSPIIIEVAKKLGASEKSGFSPPNHPFLVGFSILNHPFWGTTIFGNTQLYLKK